MRLRRHVPANRTAFQRWYADDEIANLLRHDLRPLTATQSRGYFDSFILPLSARGLCFAIHAIADDHLIGTTALTDVVGRRPAWRTAMFRIVIGEKDYWGHGFGSEATRLVMTEAFAEIDLDEVRLEVFEHNPRAIAAYRRVGFYQTGGHVEWVGAEKHELRVVEMALRRDDVRQEAVPAGSSSNRSGRAPRRTMRPQSLSRTSRTTEERVRCLKRARIGMARPRTVERQFGAAFPTSSREAKRRPQRGSAREVSATPSG